MSLRQSPARSDAPTVIFHWALVAAVLVSLSTGLRIAAADARFSSTWLETLLPQGNVERWHVWSACALICGVIAYAFFLWYAGVIGRITVSRASLRSADSETRRRAWNRAIYWTAIAFLALAGTTGGMFYFGRGPLPERTLAAVHQWAAWGFVAYIALHVAAQIWLGGARQLLKIVSPRLAYVGAGFASLCAAGVAWAIVYSADRAQIADLHIVRITDPPSLDGDPGDAAWRSAPPVTIHTQRGANFSGGETEVRVRAVHDDTNAYFLFEWQDPTRSYKHLPLLKTENGWRVLNKKYDTNDEDDYYEDKFAVMFSRTPDIGGGASHLGAQPLAGKPPASNGRGLHYTLDGTLVDVWHWKSVRSGGLGQVDDNYFGPPLPAVPGARYTGGYTQDPATGGGFAQNWDKIAGSQYVKPKRLPKDLAALQARLGRIDLDPNTSDAAPLAMRMDETVPYQPELDTYPIGTVLPSVLHQAPFVGDRGDVTAAATWKDGWWRLETRRKLDTGSKYDLPFASGIYVWVAAFDHSQVRHTRHPHPVRMRME